MPFASQAQRAWMYVNHPEMARRWEADTPKGRKLPKKKKKRKGWLPWSAKALGTVSDTAGGTLAGFPGRKKKKRRRTRVRLVSVYQPELRVAATGKAWRPWKEKAIGRFDESKHPRSHGKFSRGAGSRGPAPDAEGRHPSAHDPSYTYGNRGDRDADDRAISRGKRAQRKVDTARQKLETTRAAGPQETPEIRALRAQLAEHTARADKARQRVEKLTGKRQAQRPAASGSRDNPDLDAAMGMEANRLKLARVGGDPFAEHQTGTQNVREFPKRAQPPATPHERTQQAAMQAARSVKPGDQQSHAAAVQALDAHLKAGLAELRRRTEHAGPRAGNMYRRAAQEFKAKLSRARARIDQLAGRGPLSLRGRGQEYRMALGERPTGEAHHQRPKRRGPPPPRLQDRGKVYPFVSMKELSLPLAAAWVPWMMKQFVPFLRDHRKGEPALIDIPDIRQEDDYSCWAAQTMGVARHFGVGPTSLDKWKKILGTNPETSASYDRVVQVLRKFGLSAEPRHHMSVEDLEAETAAGRPVLCAVQDYGPALNKRSKFDYGHCLTVIGAHFGYVFVQDSSEENALEGEGSLSSDGRDMISVDVWNQNWYDRDSKGKKYTRFGIVVGPPER